MAKILLVEDDNNLREIYEARLMAEGYEIVSARDGEEALSVAMKEKPDLIISDVMMPKISGFDMLDILRSTEETKDAKVIMMTALSQAEDKARAKKLGADRYLVKSQVTLEDVARVAKEVLDGVPAPEEPTASVDSAPSFEVKTAATVVEAAAAETDESASVKPVPAPVTETPTPEKDTPVPIPEPVAPAPDSTTSVPVPEPVVAPLVPEPVTDSDDDTSTDDTKLDEEVNNNESTTVDEMATTQEKSTEIPSTPSPEPVAVTTGQPQTAEAPEKTEKKVISPINDVNEDKSEHLNRLAEKEAAMEEALNNPKTEETIAPAPAPAPETTTPPASDDNSVDPNSIAL